MRREALCLLMLLTALAACKKTTRPQPASPLARTRQLLVVRAPQWSSSTATLQRWERNSRSGPWQLVGTPIAVSLGRAGLAWGRGVHGEPPGDAKREGDGRSPAGMFALKSTFGEWSEPAGNLPYIQATQDTLCIDDPKSVRYNKIVQKAEIQFPDWGSFEQLKRDDGQYKVAIVVEHNAAPVQAGAGSCIFLHARATATGTNDGCTAMDAESVLTLARWLDWMAEPVLVQLPDNEYVRVRSAWQLP